MLLFLFPSLPISLTPTKTPHSHPSPSLLPLSFTTHQKPHHGHSPSEVTKTLTIATHQNLNLWLRFEPSKIKPMGFESKHGLWLGFISTRPPLPCNLLIFSLRSVLWCVLVFSQPLYYLWSSLPFPPLFTFSLSLV